MEAPVPVTRVVFEAGEDGKLVRTSSSEIYTVPIKYEGRTIGSAKVSVGEDGKSLEVVGTLFEEIPEEFRSAVATDFSISGQDLDFME